MTSYQRQVLIGVLGVFLVGAIAGYSIAKWGAAPPCQVTDVSPSTTTPVKTTPDQTGSNPQIAATGIVKNVIDGATIEVESVGTVKLAGVDVSPKVVNDDSDPTHKDALTYL